MKNIGFDDIEKYSDGLVIIYIWAEWCGPCKKMKPVLEKINGVEILTLEFDPYKDQIESSEYATKSLPTLHFVVDGELVKSHSGAVSKAQIEAMIASI